MTTSNIIVLHGKARYAIIKKVGEGTYGAVYKAEDKQTGAIVAMKKIHLFDEEEGVPCTTLREISVLRELSSHPHIVKLIDVIHKNSKLYLILEFLDQDLHMYINSTKEPISPALIKSYLYQLLSGVQYLHAQRVFHRDLKPQNLLIDKQGWLKIADFGLARAFSVPHKVYTHEVVTRWYRAPEILLGMPKYSMAIDVWSIGCIFAEMVTKQPLFAGDSDIDQLFRISKVLGSFTEESWPGVSKLPAYSSLFPVWRTQDLKNVIVGLGEKGVDLLQKMLVYNPEKRISAGDALQHEYFADLDKKIFADAMKF